MYSYRLTDKCEHSSAIFVILLARLVFHSKILSLGAMKVRRGTAYSSLGRYFV